MIQGEKNALENQVHVLTAARDSAPRQPSPSKAARKRSKGASSSSVTSPAQQVCPLLHCPSRHFICCVARGVEPRDSVFVANRLNSLKQPSDSLHIDLYLLIPSQTCGC